MISAIDHLKSVHQSIETACTTYKRSLDDVTLIAVSKTFGVEHIRPVIEAGQRVFGENRVQEAQSKWPMLRDEAGARGDQIELHLIGPLQSNKASDAVALFDWIETVDREKIAKALASELQKQGRAPKLLVQVNTGAEPQKAGVLPEDLEGFLQRCQTDYDLPIKGLMCIPPIDENPGPHFALIDKMASQHRLTVRSMGMSGDYETAIQMGATHVRIGSAIFGDRSKPA